MRPRLLERTASRRRRGIAVIVLLIAVLLSLMVGRWIFWIGMAVFLVTLTADLVLRDRPLD